MNSHGFYLRKLADLALPFAREIYYACNTPLSAEAMRLLSDSDYKGLLNLEVNPLDYTNWDLFKRDYLVVNLLSKYPYFDIGLSPSDVAIQKFRESEENCRLTNERLRDLSQRDPLTSAVLLTARRKIDRLLPPFSWDDAAQRFDWGPGASTSLNRRLGDSYYKWGNKSPHATRQMEPLIFAMKKFFCRDDGWDFEPIYVSGSTGTTVPKNAKSDRFIAIEPDLNLFVQKGIGALIRLALNKIGLLHPASQETNQSLAREGSVSRNLATLDLSSASDTIARELVEQLIPKDWLQALEQCRSPVCVLPSGEIHFLEKVSSMGNGFTFELETLIFWALSSAVSELVDDSERRVCVYGDDIIVGTKTARALIPVLQYCGFTTNKLKTFIEGPFRESCGKHYFDGHDVSPFFVRSRIDSSERTYLVANSLLLWARLPFGVDSTYERAHDLLLSRLNSRERVPTIDANGPLTAGVIRNLCEALPVLMSSRRYPAFKRSGLSGWLTPNLRRLSNKREVTGYPRLLKSLWNKGEAGELNHKVLIPFFGYVDASSFEDSTSAVTVALPYYEIGEVHVPTWTDVGPWV